MEKEGLIHIIKIKTDENHRKRKFRWVNFYSISLCVFILFIPLVYLLTNIDKIIYSIKPYSVLDFEKLETKKPEGTICKVEGDPKLVVSQGIIWKDDTISIYEDFRFEKLVKSIKLPGLIEDVNCYYPDDYSISCFDFKSYGIDFAFPGNLLDQDNETAFIMSAVYVKNGEKNVLKMSIPYYRFHHYNFMNDPQRKRSELRSNIEIAQACQNSWRKQNNLEQMKIVVDENPKNPFEYLSIEKDDQPLPVNNDPGFDDFIYNNLTDGNCIYKPRKKVQFLLNKPVLKTWITRNMFKVDRWRYGNPDRAIAVTKSNENPTVITRLIESEYYGLNILKTKNIDEPVNDFHLTSEHGKPVLYFFSEQSIFRWENTASDFTNLKPEILFLKKDILNKIN